MGTHMKTTIEISDAIFERAKALAAREGTTVRALVEDGLRQILKSRKQTAPFRLRDAAFGGSGLQPEFRDADWNRIRAALYEDRA